VLAFGVLDRDEGGGRRWRFREREREMSLGDGDEGGEAIGFSGS